jgi:CDGSH-type Zn-finger protein
MAAQRPAAVITACPDGPLLVRGDFDLVSASGEPVPRQRRTVALCRCGFSAIKPYCDGSHKAAGFRTQESEEHPRSLDSDRGSGTSAA